MALYWSHVTVRRPLLAIQKPQVLSRGLDGNLASLEGYLTPLDSHLAPMDGHLVPLDGHLGPLDGPLGPLHEKWGLWIAILGL